MSCQEFLGEGTVSMPHPAVGQGRRMEALLLTALKDMKLSCFLLKSLSDFELASFEIVEMIRESWAHPAGLSQWWHYITHSGVSLTQTNIGQHFIPVTPAGLML